jgi:tetratricopeptide (TPR) repeat protein
MTLPQEFPVKRRKPFVWVSAVVLAGAAIIAGGIYGTQALCTHRAITQADEALKKNFAALAADRVESHRHAMLKSEHGCSVMIQAYHDSRNLPRLEWASQACMDAGWQIPEAFLGMASASEATGHDVEALEILMKGVAKYQTLPEFYVRMAGILKRNKRPNETVANYMKAVEYAPNNNALAWEALQYFVSVQRWAEGKQMVDKLKSVQTVNPEIKLVMARVLLNFGDRGSSKAMAAEGKQLMAKLPAATTKQLEKDYSDVLGTG